MKRFNVWLIARLNKFLSSITGLYIALVVPIAVIWAPSSIKSIENILSSNWLQLWALFALAIIAVRSSEQENVHHVEQLAQRNKHHKEQLKHLEAIHKHLGIKELK